MGQKEKGRRQQRLGERGRRLGEGGWGRGRRGGGGDEVWIPGLLCASEIVSGIVNERRVFVLVKR